MSIYHSMGKFSESLEEARFLKGVELPQNLEPFVDLQLCATAVAMAKDEGRFEAKLELLRESFPLLRTSLEREQKPVFLYKVVESALSVVQRRVNLFSRRCRCLVSTEAASPAPWRSWAWGRCRSTRKRA